MTDCNDEHSDLPSRPDRWATLRVVWPGRAKMAAEELKSCSRVVDIGCGAGSLQAALNTRIDYVGVDIVARGPDTLVVDLNSEDLPEIDADAAAILGVLEYVNIPGRVLRQLHRFDKIIITYNHKSVHDLLWKLGLRQKKVGWRHRMSRSDFVTLVKKSGLVVDYERRVRLGETMFICRPANRVASRM